MINIFERSLESLFHISVGAVVVNGDDQVLLHHWEHMNALEVQGEDVYLLMRETVEMGESLEQTVHRGLMEEFGAAAEIQAYIGSIVSRPPHEDKFFEKTTLYFLCKIKSLDPQKRAHNDPEGGSIPVFRNLEDIIPRMKEQGVEFKRDDLDESKILQEALKRIRKK